MMTVAAFIFFTGAFGIVLGLSIIAYDMFLSNDR